jgi:hypothetical protein
MAAATLIMLLSVSVYLTKYSRKWWILACGVAIFSVHSTSSGQAFAFFSAEAANAGILKEKEFAQKDYERADKELTKLTEEYSKMEEEVSSTVKTLEDRYKWKNTSSMVEELKNTNLVRQSEARDKLASSKSILLKITSEVKIGLYEYYANLLQNKLSSSSLQFFDHLYLSILLMLAAPTGVKLWGSKHKETDEEEKITRDDLAVDLPFLDTEVWKNLPDPAPLRPASRAVGVAHTVLYGAHKKGSLQVKGMPWKVEKKELVRFMADRLRGSLGKDI